MNPEFTILILISLAIIAVTLFIGILHVMYYVIRKVVRPIIRELGIRLIPFDYQPYVGIKRFNYYRRKHLTYGKTVLVRENMHNHEKEMLSFNNKWYKVI